MNLEIKQLTLQELFNKYYINTDIINYREFNQLTGDLSNYFIASRGDGMGIVVINKNEINCFASFTVYPIEQLLQLKVDVSSWNKYRWSEKELNEEEVVLNIFSNCPVINAMSN